MSNSNEQIEAKLAAYVDGELDAAGRVEIEKHLSANPQHRQLLSQLIVLREMTRGLPRMSAPADVIEALGGQLERSALLDDIDADSDALALRTNRWPQFRALAAVLVLSLGLAGAVYLLLPSPQSSTAEHALLKTLPESSAPDPGSIAAADGEAMPVVRRDATRNSSPDAATPTDKAAALSLAPARPSTPESDGLAAAAPAAPAGIAPAVTNTFSPQEQAIVDAAGQKQKLDLAGVTQQMASGLSTQNATELLVVATERPADAGTQLTSYLTDNRIEWQPMAEPAGGISGGGGGGGGGGAGLDASRAGGGPSLASRFGGELAQADPLTTSTTQTALAGTAPTQVAAGARQGYPGQLQYGRGENDSAQNSQVAQTQNPQDVATKALDRRVSNPQQIYVARNLTRRQANDLKSSLDGYRAKSYGQNKLDITANALQPSSVQFAPSAAAPIAAAPIAAVPGAGAPLAATGAVEAEARREAADAIATRGATPQPSTLPVADTDRKAESAQPNVAVAEGVAVRDGAPAVAVTQSVVDTRASGRLGAGDSVLVEIGGIAGLPDDAKHRLKIGEDGMLDVPLAGQILAGGFEPDQVGTAIANRLREGNVAQAARIRVTTTPSALVIAGPANRPGEGVMIVENAPAAVPTAVQVPDVTLTPPGAAVGSAGSTGRPIAVAPAGGLPAVGSPVNTDRVDVVIVLENTESASQSPAPSIPAASTQASELAPASLAVPIPTTLPETITPDRP